MKVKDLCIYCENGGNSGLMICCDRCESWYHYRRANPSLKLKYYSSDNFNLVPLGLNDLHGRKVPIQSNTSPASPSSSSDASWASTSTSSSSNSSSIKSDEAIENKHPDRSKQSGPLFSRDPTRTTQQKHQHQHQPQQQQQQQNQQQSQQQQNHQQLQATGKMSDNKRKKAFKSSRAKLRSKLQKAMRRQRHPSTAY